MRRAHHRPAPGRGPGLRIGFEMISAGSGFHPGAGGMISYYDGLLRALCERHDVASVVCPVAPFNGDLAVPDHPKIQTVTCRGLPHNRAGRVAYEQLVLPLLVRRLGVDVLVSTVNIMPLLRRAPTVVVLQSIQYFMWPTQVGRLRRAYLRFFTPRSLRKAGAVITVTDAERADALALFGADPARLLTVHHGVSNWTGAALNGTDQICPHRLPGGAPYALVVSRLYDFKNHRRLIEAFAQLTADPAIPHHLVIAGGDADVTRAQLAEHAARHGVGDRVHCLGAVPQDDIPGLFAGASAIAYVSLYETFGHPVLEAFAFGLPLVTSSVGATAEVAGEAARLVDPHSVEDIAAGLRDVLTDDELRARLAAAGPRRAATFSWDKCAQGTMEAVELAMSAPVSTSASEAVRLQREYYARTAHEYDEMHTDEHDEHYVALGHVVDFLRQIGARSVLDTGCGTGRAIRYLMDQMPELAVHGNDPSAELLEIATRRYGIAPERLACASSEALPYPDGAFDVVLETGMLHHVPRAQPIVAEMLRVASRAIFISDCNIYAMGSLPARLAKLALARAGLLRPFNRLRRGGHEWYYGPGDGVGWSYSVFDSLPAIRKDCGEVIVIATALDDGRAATRPLLRSTTCLVAGFKEPLPSRR